MTTLASDPNTRRSTNGNASYDTERRSKRTGLGGVPAAQHAPPPQEQIIQMMVSFWTSRALWAAARLRLADYVEAGATTPAELAAATGTHEPSLRRLLRALVAAGIFSTDPHGRLAQTPLSATLRSGAAGSLRATVDSVLGGEHYDAWGGLLHSLRTGQTAFDQIFAEGVWSYYSRHDEPGSRFDAAMTEATATFVPQVLEACDYSSIERLVDVAGGEGELLASVLARYPSMAGVLFDLPPVAQTAYRRMEARGLSPRCTVVGGDMFDSVPAGADAYQLKWILHDWDDDRCVRILRNIHGAMAPGGKVLAIESVVPAGDDPSFAKLGDLNMLVMTGGRERTEAEFRALYDRAGFELTRVVPTTGPLSIIEGVRHGE